MSGAEPRGGDTETWDGEWGSGTGVGCEALGSRRAFSAVGNWIESFPQNNGSQSEKETCSVEVNQHDTELSRRRANYNGELCNTWRFQSYMKPLGGLGRGQALPLFRNEEN